MAINKVVINNSVKLDLTEDTVTPETLKSGVTAHNAAGEAIVGTMSSGPSISYKQVNVGTEWTEGDDLWYQDISVDGLLASDHITVDILLSDDIDDANDELDNYDLIFRIQNLDGKVRIYSVEETYVALKFMLEIKSGVIVPEVTNYTNMLPLATDTDGSIYNTKGWSIGYRLTSSGIAEGYSGMYLTGFIPIKIGDIVRLKDITWQYGKTSGITSNNQRLCFYNSSKSFIGLANGTGAGGTLSAVKDENNIWTQFTVKSFSGVTLNDVAYFRLCCAGITDESIITVNEEID